VGTLLSVTVTAKENAPVAVAVPLSAPPEESATPAGRLPVLTAKAYGAVPPIAVSVVLNAVFACSETVAAVVMLNGAGSITIIVLPLAVAPALSVTCTVIG
jgi:hypothetical protein